MALSLETRIETFLGQASFLSFAYREKPAVLSFLFEEKAKLIFMNKENHEDLRNFFRGRKIRLVTSTSGTSQTTVSLVDVETADAIRIVGPKFVTNNIILFREAKIPEDTSFFISLMIRGKTPDGEKAMAVHPFWADKKPLQIHGYSLIDNRAE